MRKDGKCLLSRPLKLSEMLSKRNPYGIQAPAFCFARSAFRLQAHAKGILEMVKPYFPSTAPSNCFCPSWSGRVREGGGGEVGREDEVSEARDGHVNPQTPASALNLRQSLSPTKGKKASVLQPNHSSQSGKYSSATGRWLWGKFCR